MNALGINDVRQTEIHREPPVPEIEMAIEKLERHKSSGVHPHQNGLKQELTEEWKEFIIVPIYKKADKRDCSN